MKRFITLMAAFVGLTTFAETFYWLNDQSDMARSFGSYANWGVGTDSSATNPNQLVPGATDDICIGNAHDDWNNLCFFDLSSGDWTVRNLVNGCYSDAQFRYWHLHTGSLTFTGEVDCKRWYVDAYEGSKLTFGETSTGRFGYNTLTAIYSSFTAHAGAEIDLKGTMKITGILIKADGGKIVFDPAWIGGDSDTFGSERVAKMTNAGGTIECPNGIYFQGSGPDWDGYFHVYQNSGTMVLGGPVKHNSHRCRLQFHFAGGTIHATDDVSFSSDGNDGLYKREMTADAVATVEVDANKTVDFKSVSFGSNTTLTKTGAGTVSFSGSFPTALTVSAGECVIASSLALGDGLTLSAGSVLTLAALNSSATSIAGLADATIKVSPKVGNGLVFASSDSELATAVAEKLTASSTDVGEFTVTNEGVQFVRHLAFTWAYDHDTSGVYRSYNAAANWAVGTSSAAGNYDQLVPASGDDLCYGEPDGWNNSVCMDLGTKSYTVRNLLNGRPSDNYIRYWRILSGSLTFTGAVDSKRWYAYAMENGKLVFASTSEGRFGNEDDNGAICAFTAENGGEIDFLGTMKITSIGMTANAGGKIVFNPAWLGGDTKTFGYGKVAYLQNNGGTVECPNGIYFTGEGPDWDGYFHVYQNSGTMVLGGPVVHNSNHCRLQFHLSGGTIHVTDNVDFHSDGFDALYLREMTADAEITLIVDEGKTIDFSSVIFRDNTTIHKYGKGRVKFGDSRPTVYDRPGATGMYILK